MFRSYVFTEMPYPHARLGREVDTVKFGLPNSRFDPDDGMELYGKYLDIYQAADGLGLDIMCNEHHGSAACINSAAPLFLAILARTTRHARLLALGNPVANRGDPIRVAEEFATIDVLSGGRCEAGLVRGSPEELITTNTNPVGQRERFWEAVDLIVRAWTTHSGPFSWEGAHFHHREVNIWPRPYTSPHPPVWITTLTPGSSAEIAARRFVVATIMNGVEACRAIFDAYRESYSSLHGEVAPLDRLSYTANVFVADTDEIALREAKKLQWHLKNVNQPLQFANVPGNAPAAARAQILKEEYSSETTLFSNRGEKTVWSEGPIESLAGRGLFFVGNPDTVFRELRDFYDAVGGFARFIMAVQSSSMSYQTTVRSMERFSRDVLPRFREEVYVPSLASRDALGRVCSHGRRSDPHPMARAGTC